MANEEDNWRNSFVNLEKAIEAEEEKSSVIDDVFGVLATAINKMERQLIGSILSNKPLNDLVLRTLRRINPAEEEDEEDDTELFAAEMDDATTGQLTLRIDQAINIPVSPEKVEKRKIGKSGYLISASVLRGKERKKTFEAETGVCSTSKSFAKFREDIDLGDVRLDDTLCFTLKTSYMKSVTDSIRLEVGKARVRVSELLLQAQISDDGKRAEVALWITDGTEIFVFDYDLDNPTMIIVSFDLESLPENFAKPTPVVAEDAVEEPKYDKHCMVITRGTRGDVQPFIALARGLAEMNNWLITICTETRYLPLISRYSEVKRGRIQFRPCGGDTEKRIDGALAKWAFKQTADVLQVAILGRSEREFFDAEPAFHYWASRMNPDVLLFGFTTMNISMVLSESLRIPMIGFLLQPTFIPSAQYPSIVPIQSKYDPLTAHKWNFRAKQFFENNPLDVTSSINYMRSVRGLQPFSHRVNNVNLMLKQDTPLIIPINQLAFGGKPPDWSPNTHLTESIFLRTGAVPNLKPRLVKILIDAKCNKEPVVAMCFSSMPVSRTKILELAIMMIEQSKYKPRVIALVGQRNMDSLPAEGATAKSIDIEDKAAALIKSGKLLLQAGAPYSKVFPQVDYVIMHGGLGTTTECLSAGVPCVVTGILLLDQRFWGQRLHDLGVGEKPVHINDLQNVLLKYVDGALAPGNRFAKRAKEVAQELLANGSVDGVAENVEAVARVAETAIPVAMHRESIMRSPQAFANALAEDVSRTVQDEAKGLAGEVVTRGKKATTKFSKTLKDKYGGKGKDVKGLITNVLVHNAFELRSVMRSKLKEGFLQKEKDS